MNLLRPLSLALPLLCTFMLLTSQVSAQAAPKKLPQPDEDTLNAAYALTKQGKHKESWQKLAPLIDKYPAHGHIQHLGCYYLHGGIDSRKNPLEACKRAANLNPDLPDSALRLAQIYLQKQNYQEAFQTLEGVRTKFSGKPDATPHLFNTAALFLEGGFLSAAEKTLEPLSGNPQAKGLQKTIANRRLLFSMPTSTPQEADLYRHLQPFYLAQQKNDAVGIASSLKALQKAYPKHTGTLLASCEAALFQKKHADALPFCEKALKQSPKDPVAQARMGRVYLQKGDLNNAQKHLKASIQTNKDYLNSWLNLAQVLRGQKKDQELQTLKADFQKHFGQPMPEK